MAVDLVAESPPRLVTTSIQVPPELLAEAESEAGERHVSRSDVLRLWMRVGKAEVQRLRVEGRLVA